MDKSRYVVYNILIVVIHKALVYSSIFVVESKYIGETEQFTLFVTLLNGVILFSNSGVVERALYSKIKKPNLYISHCIYISLCVSMISSVIMFGMSKNVPYAIVVFISSLVFSAATILTNHNKIQADFKKSFEIYALYIIFPTLVFFVPLFYSFILAYLLFVPTAIFLFYLSIKNISQFNYSVFKKVFKYNSPYIIQNSFNYVSGFGMNIIISIMINNLSMIRYTKIIIISSIVSLVAQTLNNILLGYFNKNFREKSKKYDKLFSIFYIIIINILVILYIAVNDYVSFFSRSDSLYIVISIIPYVFNIVYWVNAKYYPINNENWSLIRNNIYAGIVSLIISMPAIYYFKFNGIFVYITIYPLIRSLLVSSYRYGFFNVVNTCYLVALPMYFLLISIL